MTEETYRRMLARGGLLLDERMKKAQKSALLTMNCTGRKDCKAEHHICICHSQKGT